MSALTLLLLLGQVGQPPAPPKAKPKLAVFDVQALSGVTPDLAQSVSGVLVVEVRKRATDYSVIGADEIRSLLNAERMRQQMGCSQASCLAEIGGALGASQIVNGQLSKLGSVYVLTLKLLDTRKGSVVRDATAQISSGDQAALIDAVKQLAAKLFPGAQDEAEQQADLFAENTPPEAPSRSHTLAWILGATAIAAGAVAIVGLVEVQSYNSNVNGWNTAYTKGAALGANGSSISSMQSQATAWEVVGFAGLGAALLSGGGAVIAW